MRALLRRCLRSVLRVNVHVVGQIVTICEPFRLILARETSELVAHVFYVGQWLQMKAMTSPRAAAKSSSVQTLPL